MQGPFFTVVIPTYNRPEMLKRAIGSVIEQTFGEIEIIVVDDHSTEDTALVVSSFCDSRIRYMMNHRTKGACGARNVGVFSANGKWVAFLDDDDIWLPDKLSKQYEAIRSAKATVGLVCSDYAIFKGEDQKPLIIKNRPSGWVADKILYGGIIGCLSSTCIRSDILRKIEGFDESFPSNQDQDLWLRVAEFSEFTHVPATLVSMYQEYRKDRIGQNAKSKLEGYIMLRNKYSGVVNKSLRLRHHLESHILTYALLQKDRFLVAKCIPWVLLGTMVDLPNFLRTTRNTLLLMFRKRARAHLS